MNGFRDVARGFAVLRAHRALWKWVIAPAVVTLVLFAGLFGGILWLIHPVTDWLIAHLPGWLAGAAGPMVTAAVALALAVCGFSLFVWIVGAIAGPFNESLSERVEVAITGQPMSPFSLGEFVRGLVLGIGHAIRRLLASLLGLVLVLALGLVPILGTVAAVAFGAWLAATAAAYDCYDAVLARRFWPYRQKLDYLARYRMRTLGLGAAVAGLLLVPGLNLIALGLGAAGATVAAHELERDSAAERDPRHDRPGRHPQR